MTIILSNITIKPTLDDIPVFIRLSIKGIISITLNIIAMRTLHSIILNRLDTYQYSFSNFSLDGECLRYQTINYNFIFTIEDTNSLKDYLEDMMKPESKEYIKLLNI